MRQRGFTLVEVMIALAILAGGLVVLLRATASNVMAAQRAQMLTAATSLARGKMYDLEETLLAEGFQEMDQEESGDFGEEGWKQIEWKATIVKIELPDLAALQTASGAGEGGAEGEAAGGGMLGGGGLLGMLGMGTAAQQGQEAMGAGIMGTFFPIVKDVLMDGIRKISLVVTYPVVGGEEELEVTYYVTDPAAVGKNIPVGALGGGEDEGEGEGTANPSPNPNPNPSPSPNPKPNPSGGGATR